LGFPGTFTRSGTRTAISLQHQRYHIVKKQHVCDENNNGVIQSDASAYTFAGEVVEES
jgi:predicted RNA methylase